MSEIVKSFADHLIAHRPTWWLILDCGHWYHWTGTQAPTGESFDCPECKPLVAAYYPIIAAGDNNDTKCAVCGLNYFSRAPKPCPHANGPEGLNAETRQYMKCTFVQPETRVVGFDGDDQHLETVPKP